MSAGTDGAAYVVRPARHGDVLPLLDLLEAVAAEGRWIGTEAPVDREARHRQISETVEGSDRAARFVAASGGVVVGNLWIDLRPYNVADLGMLVAAQWRRRGVGSALMEAGIAWAGAAGAHKVVLQVWPHNHGALALYTKFGFVQEGLLRRHYPRRNGELWDAVMMGLVLDSHSPGPSIA
jgi:RimJ/RimL family protein N-acetyltransferase